MPWPRLDKRQSKLEKTPNWFRLVGYPIQTNLGQSSLNALIIKAHLFNTFKQ